MLLEGEKHERAGRTVVYLKSALDDRYGRNTLTVSHDGIKRESFAVNGSFSAEIKEACLKADVVCIDEAQFINGVAGFCDEMARVHHKRVLVAALDGDFERKPFESIVELLPLCDKFTKLNSVCVECGHHAPFTRKIGGSISERVDVGGAEKYVPTCRQHHSDSPVTEVAIERMKAINGRLSKSK